MDVKQVLSDVLINQFIRAYYVEMYTASAAELLYKLELVHTLITGITAYLKILMLFGNCNQASRFKQSNAVNVVTGSIKCQVLLD